jgi:CTP synthase
LCLGLQCAVIEFARDVLGINDAHSTEFDPTTQSPVIDLMLDQHDVEDMGGTMRLGLYPAKLAPGSLADRLYGEQLVYERHRHRWEVNNRYRRQLTEAGMVASGVSPDDRLVEIIELPGHPYFIASQFHPEFTSRPERPNPLFAGLVAAALEYKRAQQVSAPLDADVRVDG